MAHYFKAKEGFTLVEILIAVALIAILATVTIVAINPAKNFADTRNAQRSADVNQILNAVSQYAAEEKHAVSDFGTITACTAGADAIGTTAGNIDLSATLVDDYIVGIPLDPSTGTAGDTGYTICLTSSSRVQIAAPGAENGKTIVVKR